MAKLLLRDRLRRIPLALRSLFRPRQIERELEEELQFHLAHETRSRRVEHGRLEATKESYRQSGDLYGLTTLVRDLRYGARLLRRNLMFTMVAVGTLALGIGLNVALFSVVHEVLLAPLPYAHSDRLVTLASSSVAKGLKAENVGWMTAEDWRARNHSFVSIGTYSWWTPTLSGAGMRPRVLRGLHASWDFFPTLGVTPALGRGFSKDEDRPHRDREVILSNAFWRQQFGGDRGVIGRSMMLDQVPFRIIGVMPASFDADPFRRDVALWKPMGYDATVPDACRSCQHLQAVGGLGSGVSIADARGDMTSVERQLTQSFPGDYARDAIVAMQPLREAVVGSVGRLLWMLLAAAALVLLIAGANLANLLLARASVRDREVALRAALGAGRGRLVRQLVTEGALLGLLGGAAGAGLAALAMASLRPWAAAALPRLSHLNLNAATWSFALALSLAAGILISLAPAMQLVTGSDGRSHAAGARAGLGAKARTRHILVAGEVALAVLLAVGAGLVLKSFIAVLGVAPGLDPSHVYTADFRLPTAGYPNDAAAAQFDRQLLTRLGQRLGAGAVVALDSVLPFDPGNYDTRAYAMPDPPILSQTDVTRKESFYDTYFVSPGYFGAMGIRLERGHEFTDDDLAHPGNSIIVSESMARLLWPGREPLGKAIVLCRTKDDIGHWAHVVGVAADVHQYGLERPAPPEAYVPYTRDAGNASTLIIRSSLPLAVVSGLVESTLARVAPSVPIENQRSMESYLSESMAQRRMTLELFAAFTGLALALAGLGIYGVVAFTTSRRTGEIGLRLTLGARPAEIVRLVVAGSLRPALVGIMIGAAAALLAGRAFTALVYRVSPADPETLAAAVAALLAIALLAAWLPAWRASRIDPASALRAE